MDIVTGSSRINETGVDVPHTQSTFCTKLHALYQVNPIEILNTKVSGKISCPGKDFPGIGSMKMLELKLGMRERWSYIGLVVYIAQTTETPEELHTEKKKKP